MTDKKLVGLFESFLAKDDLFLEKRALQANYTPLTIPHREEQTHQIAQILAPALRLNKPSNLFLYGKTGTGKTLSVLYTIKNLTEVAAKQKIALRTVYVNCKLKKVADTEYRLIAQIARDLGQEIPITGLPTQEVYRLFTSVIDAQEQLLILVLDEIDQLVKKIGDEILYTLTRINAELKKSQVTIIGISNDLVFADNLEPRVKSSLSEEELIFPPYNALQLQDILRSRSKIAFKPNVLGLGVIEKCAAFAAREHGDARRALELLRVAGELAERAGNTTVKIKDIDDAEEKIERERVFDIITAQPKQFQLVLHTILSLFDRQRPFISTGEIYDAYRQHCARVGFRPLTQRRVSDILAELDMLGILNATVLSKGRYGRTREIRVAIADQMIPRAKEILEKELDLK